MPRSLNPFIRKRKGFTLIEVTLTLMVLGLVAVCGYDALRVGTRRLRGLTEMANAEADAGIAFAVMERDIRCAFLSSDIQDSLFIGRGNAAGVSDQLDFTRSAPLSADDPLRLWEIGFSVTLDPHDHTGSLERRVQDSFDHDPISGGTKRRLLTGVQAVHFRYFDGETWRQEWGWNAATNEPMRGIRGLPVLVEIELTLNDASGQSVSRKKRVPVMLSILNRKTYG